MEENIALNHSVIIEDRKKLSLSGVKECIGFDEETILLNTVLGKLTIKGSGLHIQNFDTESGGLEATGKVHAVVYTTDDSRGGFWSRVFR